jgi:hypothetical protein
MECFYREGAQRRKGLGKDRDQDDDRDRYAKQVKQD